MASIVGSATAASACDLCKMTLPHRTGYIVLHARTDRTTYAPCARIPLRISVTNRGDRPLDIDFSSPVSQIELQYAAPTMTVLERDVRIRVRGHATLAPTATASFSPTSLQHWGFDPCKPGSYVVELSYRGVDSNPIAFTIR